MESVISIEDFRNYFGYCLDLVIEQKSLMEYLNNDDDYWRELLKFTDLYKKYKIKKNLQNNEN